MSNIGDTRIRKVVQPLIIDKVGEFLAQCHTCSYGRQDPGRFERWSYRWYKGDHDGNPRITEQGHGAEEFASNRWEGG